VLGIAELEHLAKACTAIANDVSDDNGFVPIRSLLARFHARLLARPLLVEGMLASEESRSDKNKWLVLVDSESYDVSDGALAAESSHTPLESRLRNTIAHELVHSLAFRPSEFGVRLKGQPKNGEDSEEVVRSIERETEHLSPLLLWSERGLEKFLKDKQKSCSIDDLMQAVRSVGISRTLMVNRLRLLRPTNRLRDLPGLRNITIGLAEWNKWGTAVLKGWPLFVNFDRNIAPGFCFTLLRQEGILAQDVWPDPSFVMCGGPKNSIDLTVDAGTQQSPDSLKMKIRVSSEDCEKKDGAEFMYVANRLD
jgi:hypothetical protein